MTLNQYRGDHAALAEILQPAEFETLPEALRRVLAAKDAEVAAASVKPAPAEPLDDFPDVIGIPITPPADVYVPDPPKADSIDPALGDLTPWFAAGCIANDLAAARERYLGREQYLPPDLQEALKGGK